MWAYWEASCIHDPSCVKYPCVWRLHFLHVVLMGELLVATVSTERFPERLHWVAP